MYLKSVLTSLVLTLLLILWYNKYHNDDITVTYEKSLPTQAISFQTHKADPAINTSSFRKAAEQTILSVVSIATIKEIDENQMIQTSSGSGVIVSPDGYIITSLHVISNEHNLKVILHNRREYTAQLIGIDRETDLALLKIDEEALIPIEFYNSDSIHIGEWVIAVGNPLELTSTVTAGIISAKNRDINMNDQKNAIEAFIQTDAVVSQGNSGGALVNIQGQLVGINAAMITYSGNYEGYSFAIPSNLVRKVYSDLKNYGSVSRGYMGIEVKDVSFNLAQSKKLKEISGVLIEHIDPKGPAINTVLKQGDVVLKVNNRKINSVAELTAFIALFNPGNEITITYSRYGKIDKCKLILKNMNGTGLTAIPSPRAAIFKLGLEVKNTSDEQNSKKIDGIRVVSIAPGSKIARTQMKPDFIITKIDDFNVSDVREFGNILNDRSGRIVLEGYYENQEGPFWYVFEL